MHISAAIVATATLSIAVRSATLLFTTAFPCCFLRRRSAAIPAPTAVPLPTRRRPFKLLGSACLLATSALGRRRRCCSCHSQRQLLRHFKCQRPGCFLRRQSCRCLPRLPCHFRPDDGLSHFSDLRVSATSALSRRRRCRSQRRLSCHSECRRPCCFWRRRSCRFRRQRPCRCRLQCRSPRTPTAVLLPAPMVVPMLAPTAVTYSTNGRAASAFCADISSGRVDPVADGRADSSTDGGAIPGVVAHALLAPAVVPLPEPRCLLRLRHRRRCRSRRRRPC